MSIQSKPAHTPDPAHVSDFITGKHFLNHPNSLVLDSLQGLCAVNPQLVLDLQNKCMPLPSEG